MERKYILRINLFDLHVNESKIHPLFKQVLTEPVYRKTHDIINSWGDGLLDRHGETNKFIKEFQTTFSSSLWELYLNKAFKDLGYEIDYSKPSPDFNLIGQQRNLISVEAVTSNPRDVKDLDITDINENFLEDSTLKLIGKIRDKQKLYVGNGAKKFPYSSLTHVRGNPFVLAIAPFDQRFSQTQNNTAINRVLYGLEPPKNYTDSQEIVSYIINRNGQSVDLGIFTNGNYKEISAVIFSTTGTFGKAVVQAGSASFIRATRLRKLTMCEFINNEGFHKLGASIKHISENFSILSCRFVYNNTVHGSDTYLYDAHHHKESHLDGLQIYHNPYAQYPLNTTDFNSREVVHYYYNTKTNEMYGVYNDNALVSRNTYSIFQ